ncbi:hypothetical protein QTJ16_006781 [Diplocarpon rosae]|uniref:2EXR domain-containing protein n=1 Tax=Diplocarpon rosae TaxID=946125 RepID=A0AAD9SVD8_9HELO|nr:hypothetical protein QTJ16_006781 [Diplocarpon rosae]
MALAPVAHATTSAQPLSAFHFFPRLPTELQLKIWRLAANACPRSLDLWNDWEGRRRDHMIYYIQYYTTELAAKSPPSRTALASTCRLARAEAHSAYAHEFTSQMKISNDFTATMPATMYINFDIDTLVPRGHWNIVSFSDFVTRVQGRLTSVAMDVHGSFWKENVQDYVKARSWVFNGVREVLLYVGTAEFTMKGGEYLERFRRKGTGRKDLSFLEIEEGAQAESSDAGAAAAVAESAALGRVETEAERAARLGVQAVVEVRELMSRYFDMIDGSHAAQEPCSQPGRSRYFSEMESTPREIFIRPTIRLMKMVLTTPAAPGAAATVS